MKKIGLLCLAIVLALGSLGFAFAAWTDMVYVRGTVNTGEVLIGFVDQLTDDNAIPNEDPAKDWDDFGYDPIWIGDPPLICTNCPNIGKDVAITTCELLNQRTHCTGELAVHKDPDTGEERPQYGLMHITMDKVYPQYNPSVWFDIANCGSVPVVITGARVVMTSVNDTEFVVDIPLPKCTMVQIDLDKDGDEDVAIGFSMDPEEPDQQIEPCETIQYDLHFYFKQGLDECTDYDFKIAIDAIQWNKA